MARHGLPRESSPRACVLPVAGEGLDAMKTAKPGRTARIAALGLSLMLGLAPPVAAAPPGDDDLDETDDPRQPPAEPGYSSLNVTQPRGTRELQSALQRLAVNSTDLDALIDGGNAALLLGDPQAATGFFVRADELDPRNAQVKAGLGAALVKAENPREALRLFDEALALGLPESVIAADRGLAFDLVGNNDAAQADYLLALRRGGDDETIRRYALSLGIVGDRAAAEAQLDPLLRRSDPGAWRIRAFVLAINGDEDGAVAVANATMPARAAAAIAPYLRYLPRLTAAQQAAAAHFGRFPTSAEIGKEDPRNRRYAAAGGARPRGGRADAGLIPSGDPLGSGTDGRTAKPRRVDKKPRRRPGRDAAANTAAATPPGAPAQVSQPGANAAASVPLAAAPRPPAARPPAPPRLPTLRPIPKLAIPTRLAMAAAPPVLRLPPAVRPQPAGANAGIALQGPQIAPGSAEARPGFASLGAPSAASTLTSAPAPGPASTPALASASAPPSTPPAPRVSIASLVAAIPVPAEELKPDEDAVDLRTIKPARPAAPPPKKAEPPPPPKHPSRYWVQVAGGANRSTLAREWKRVTAGAPALFKGKQGWWTPLNQTNRILTGPFDSETAAQDFVNALAKEKLSGFTFTSAEGQEVTKLGG